jgi:zinc/manganese transport system substrate-binding protein
MRRRLLLSLLATPALAQPRPVLVASFSILGDMLAQVAPEGADIHVIAGPEADAHGFQPRPSQVELLRGASLAVRNGQGFDEWFDRMGRAAGFRGTMVTALEGGGLRRGDPHGWQDVTVARGYARRIAAGLGAANRLDGYDARLAELDAWIRAEIARVPPERRVVLTSHDSFGYFGAAYDVRFISPQGVSTQAEPSAQGVAALIRQVRAQRITAVFMDNLGNPSTLRRLAAEAGVTVLGRLYAESLSAASGPAATYEAMMRYNVGLMVPAMLA